MFFSIAIIILFSCTSTALAAVLPDPDSSQRDLTRRSYARLAYRSPGDTTEPPNLITPDVLEDPSWYPSSPNSPAAPASPPVQDVRAIAIFRL